VFLLLKNNGIFFDNAYSKLLRAKSLIDYENKIDKFGSQKPYYYSANDYLRRVVHSQAHPALVFVIENFPSLSLASISRYKAKFKSTWLRHFEVGRFVLGNFTKLGKKVWIRKFPYLIAKSVSTNNNRMSPTCLILLA
jgi:hypothetical protein